MAMEAAIDMLQKGGVEEFMQISSTALKVIQNVLTYPMEDKYRRIRTTCKYIAKPGAAELLVAVGFERKEEHFVLDRGGLTDSATLLERKAKLFNARRGTGLLLGWDVPACSLQFSSVLGSTGFGDTFTGQMDGRDVVIKTLKPAIGEAARESFNREMKTLMSVNHPGIVELYAVTLTSEPTSLVLEHLPYSMLDRLHSSDLSEGQVLSFVKQVSVGMEYLHSVDTLHCDLAARNISFHLFIFFFFFILRPWKVDSIIIISSD